MLRSAPLFRCFGVPPVWYEDVTPERDSDFALKVKLRTCPTFLPGVLHPRFGIYKRLLKVILFRGLRSREGGSPPPSNPHNDLNRAGRSVWWLCLGRQIVKAIIRLRNLTLTIFHKSREKKALSHWFRNSKKAPTHPHLSIKGKKMKFCSIATIRYRKVYML